MEIQPRVFTEAPLTEHKREVTQGSNSRVVSASIYSVGMWPAPGGVRRGSLQTQQNSTQH